MGRRGGAIAFHRKSKRISRCKCLPRSHLEANQPVYYFSFALDQVNEDNTPYRCVMQGFLGDDPDPIDLVPLYNRCVWSSPEDDCQLFGQTGLLGETF